jgi:hypothetical protein
MNSNPFKSNYSALPGLNNLDLEKFLNEKSNDEGYYFLLLSIYFYLKHNNYHTTAEILFNEAGLAKIFLFPQEIVDSSEIDLMKKKFVHYFYFNTFFQHSDTNSTPVDFLSDFWNQFWDIFVDKIRQSNQASPVMDQYLKGNKLQMTCKNFFNF